MAAKVDELYQQRSMPWLASYPPGVPHEIDPEYHRSLAAFFEASVQRFAHRPAFRCFGRTLTYAALDRLSLAFAAYLQQSLGLVNGDRIAIMLPNVLQYPIVLFGALRAGLIVVNTNPQHTPRELTHQLNDADAHTVLVLETFAHVLATCIDSTPVRKVIIARMGDLLPFPSSTSINFFVKHVRRLVRPYAFPDSIPLQNALYKGSLQTFERVELSPEDLAFLQYTGGTTGPAKGAMLTHRNMVASIEQAASWLRPYVVEGREVMVTALPLYHTFSLTANCMTVMKIGGLNHLIADPGNMRQVVRLLRRMYFSAITGANTLFEGLLTTPGFRGIDFSPLKISLAVGAALRKGTADRWGAATRSMIIETYGLNESAPAVCTNPLDQKAYNGCIGLPIPSTDVSVRDEHGQAVRPNTAGELWVRGPQVMRGYWRQPDETAAVLSADGWLRTCNVGEMLPDGYFRLLDRKQDIILVSGFNVYPNEVEDAIAQHSGIQDVGVIGVPDPDAGEAVMAVIVKRDPNLSATQVRAHCRTVLAPYKRPKHIRFVTLLPKNNIGKILRRELRTHFDSTPAVAEG